jgi:hypothetical protein
MPLAVVEEAPGKSIVRNFNATEWAIEGQDIRYMTTNARKHLEERFILCPPLLKMYGF